MCFGSLILADSASCGHFQFLLLENIEFWHCSLLVGERCKLPAYHSLEGFQHIGIFQLFEVKLESCVFWLADFFQAKAEGHHQQVVITSNVCS